MISVLLFFKLLSLINSLVSASDVSLKDNRRLSLTFNCNHENPKVLYKDIRSVLNSFSCYSSSASNNGALLPRCKPNPPNLEDDDSISRASFDRKCSNLNNEIKDFAMNQLGLKGNRSEFHFTNYNITNWPKFVPMRYINWDEQALVDLKAALPTMIFVKRLDTEILKSSKYYTMAREKNRRMLLDMFLESFRRQTQIKNTSYIMWSRYHLIGWPPNVKQQPDRWNGSEMLVLYRNLDNIKFEPILRGQKPTVSYADVDLETSKSRKRKFRTDLDSKDEVDDTNADNKSVAESEDHKIDEDDSVDHLKTMASLIQMPETSDLHQTNFSLESLIESDDLLDLISIPSDHNQV